MISWFYFQSHFFFIGFLGSGEVAGRGWERGKKKKMRGRGAGAGRKIVKFRGTGSGEGNEKPIPAIPCVKHWDSTLQLLFEMKKLGDAHLKLMNHPRRVGRQLWEETRYGLLILEGKHIVGKRNEGTEMFFGVRSSIFSVGSMKLNDK